MARMQAYFNSEFLASGLNSEMYDFLRRITQAKSKAEESGEVTEELANLSSKMGLPDVSSAKMKDYLIRLIHCYMLGYQVDFGIIYAIMASQSGDTALDRKVGYIACTLFLKNNHELSIMLINTLQRDLKSQNYLDQCAALNAICYIDHSEMVDGVLDLVIKAMEFPKQVVRKKAVFAAYFLYKQSGTVPIERIEGVLQQALEDKDASVVFSALSIWKLVLEEHVEEFKELLPTFQRILRQIIEKKIHKSFMYHGVLAPWAQLECLYILGIYQGVSIGSPQDLFNLTMDCLTNVERKVDTAFAIILECIKLLSSIDPLLLASLSPLDENPFDILDPFLHSSNHNLKYLGLVGLTFVDHSLWKPEWLDGSLISEKIIKTEDDTLVSQALELLNSIVDSQVLRTISPHLLEALERGSSAIGYWFINHLVEYAIVPDAWFMQTVIRVLASTGKHLDEDYVETQCSLLKSLLVEEIDETTLRESAVDSFMDLLKKTNSNVYSPLLIQFAFSTLSESAYLSNQYTEMDVMNQIQKWVVIVEDDYLQTCGLQAIKRCMLRSKTWIAGLGTILKEFKKTNIPEKREVCRELYELMNDADFEKKLLDTNLALNTKLSANPNRPTQVNRYSLENEYPRHTFKNAQDIHNYSKRPASFKSRDRISDSTRLKIKDPTTEMKKPGSTDETNLVSSLLSFELDDEIEEEEEEQLSTQAFGQRWVQYKAERDKLFECPVQDGEKLAETLAKSWQIRLVEVIGQEFIAYEGSILIHVVMQPQGRFKLTIRAQTMRQIDAFLLKRHLS
ncbi:ARM repeat-containing protein [Backusella circina FSU 941]|nr:ARM repeat-containing protein [Backusella circina FSU 941]